MVKNTVNRQTGNAGGCTENGSNAADRTAIIQNTFNCTGQSFAGSDRAIQDQDIFVTDHWLNIIAEDNLSGVIVFR